MAGQFLCSLMATNTRKGYLSRAPHHQEVFWAFYTCLEIWNSNLVYTSNKWHGTSDLSFNAIRSLWPTLQPKIGQVSFSTHGLINYMNSSDEALTLIKWFFWPLLIIVTVGQFFCTLRRGGPWLDHQIPCLWRVFQISSLNVLRYQLEIWFIHSISCTTFTFHEFTFPQNGVPVTDFMFLA